MTTAATSSGWSAMYRRATIPPMLWAMTEKGRLRPHRLRKARTFAARYCAWTSTVRVPAVKSLRPMKVTVPWPSCFLQICRGGFR